MAITRIGDHPVPWEMQDAVELWARKWGRHGRIEWVPGLRCFSINLTRRPDDPMMREWQEGRLEQASPPTESIPLQEFDRKSGQFVAMRLEDLGPSGIEALLDKANTWSGRGEVKSLRDGIALAIERNRKQKEEWAKQMNDLGKEVGALGRRTVLDLPLVSVPESLNTPTKE